MSKRKIKITDEQKNIIKKSSYTYGEIADSIGINRKRFENIMSGVIYIPDEFITKIESKIYQFKINNNLDDKPVVAGIICKICGNEFQPWGGDNLPLCKRCYDVSDFIRHNKEIILKLLDIEIKAIHNKYRGKFYWEH